MRGLSALTYPNDLSELIDNFEDNKPYVNHNLSGTVKEIVDLPFLQSLEELINSWPSDISAHLPDANDEISAINTTSKDASKLFKNGMSLLFNEAQERSEVLRRWLSIFCEEFGFSRMCYARCLVYATPANGGTAAHFDQNYNLVLQLKGEKKWWIADNEHVENPLTRHTMGHEADRELASYIDEKFPTEMPNDAKEFTLKAGSLLFVPRGSWHKTLASEDALALNFTFSAPTYLDVLTTALRGRLAQSPQWRETVYGLNKEDDFHICAHKFNLLINELKEDVSNWDSYGILGATEARE